MPVETQSEALQKLTAVLESDDYDDEFIRPTAAAARFASTLLAAGPTPSSLGAIGDGGLTAQWGGSERYVRLLIPPEPATAYLYCKSATEKGVEPASRSALSRRLSWLARDA